MREVNVSDRAYNALHELSLKDGLRIVDIIDIALIGYMNNRQEWQGDQPDIKSIVLDRWEDFKESTSAIIRFALHTATPRFEGNVLYIDASQPFTYEQLQSNIESIKDSISKFYGMDIVVQLSTKNSNKTPYFNYL